MRSSLPDPEPSLFYHLTDSQVMMLWEEAALFKTKKSPAANYLYFQMIFPAGDSRIIDKAFNQIIMANDSLRIRLKRLPLTSWPAAWNDYRHIRIPFYRLWLNRLRQSIDPYAYQALPVVELADLPAYERYLQQYRSFRQSLLDNRLFQAVIVKIGAAQWVLLARFHHVIIDGYSFKLLFEQLAAVYEAFSRAETPGSGSPSIVPYFSTDEKYRQSTRIAKDLAFWKRQFTSQPHFTFPAGRTPLVSTSQTLELNIEGPTYLGLREYAARFGVGSSNYSLLLFTAAFTVYRISGETNFALFHMSHGRADAASKQTIGTMANMIPVFFNLDVDQTFTQAVQVCKQAYLDALMHGRLSFNDYMMFYFHEALRNGLNFNHAWMVLSAEDLQVSASRTPYQVRTFGAENQPHQFFCEILEVPGQTIHISLRYQTVKYKPGQAASYLAAFEDTLRRMLNQPDARLASLRS